MTTFQLVLLAITAYFAYRIYAHIQSLEDKPVDEVMKKRPPAPFDPEALIEAADKAYEAEDLGKAKALLAEADVKMSGNPEILNRLGFILAKEGDTDRAIEHYLDSLKVEDDDMAHNAVASLYREKGDFERAKEHYERALAIDSEYAVTYFNYANLLVDMGETERAKVMYEKAVKFDPELLQAKFELDKLS